MLMLFEVGSSGEGKDSIVSEASAQLRCSRVIPVGLQPIPDEQRLEVLANLQQRYKEVSNELGMLSFRGIADSHVRPMFSNKVLLLLR